MGKLFGSSPNPHDQEGIFNWALQCTFFHLWTALQRRQGAGVQTKQTNLYRHFLERSWSCCTTTAQLLVTEHTLFCKYLEGLLNCSMLILVYFTLFSQICLRSLQLNVFWLSTGCSHTLDYDYVYICLQVGIYPSLYLYV